MLEFEDETLVEFCLFFESPRRRFDKLRVFFLLIWSVNLLLLKIDNKKKFKYFKIKFKKQVLNFKRVKVDLEKCFFIAFKVNMVRNYYLNIYFLARVE
jgi:hypothetical protein